MHTIDPESIHSRFVVIGPRGLRCRRHRGLGEITWLVVVWCGSGAQARSVRSPRSLWRSSAVAGQGFLETHGGDPAKVEPTTLWRNAHAGRCPESAVGAADDDRGSCRSMATDFVARRSIPASCASGGRARVQEPRRLAGCHRRHLVERFRPRAGLPPNALARLIRFEQVCRRMRADAGRSASDARGRRGLGRDRRGRRLLHQPRLNGEFRDLLGPLRPSSSPAAFRMASSATGSPRGTCRSSKPDRQGGATVRRDPDAKETSMAATNETAMTQTIYPALRYADADAALRWLKEALGAEENVVYRDDSGVIHHSQLRIAGGLVMMAAAAPEGWLGGERPNAKGSTVGLYIVVEDPDAHHARAVAAGASIVREPQDMPYGSREYSLRDPEGNLWSFGTYDPTAS
jgi:uncharacterized glyoxalase superfamily protein PhnB